MVTVELAVASLAALALLTMMCWAIYLVIMQMRCIDTAAEVARQSARGDTGGVLRAKRDAPAGAQITVGSSNGVMEVEVRLTARPFAEWLVAVPLRAEAKVVAEPGLGGS